MYRLQLLMRPWGSKSDGVTSRIGGPLDIPNDACLNLIMGIMEVPARKSVDDVMRWCVLDLRMDQLAVGNPELIGTEDERSSLAVSDIKQWMTKAVWKGTRAHQPVGIVTGQVISRACSLEASPGHQTVVLFGIGQSAPGTLKDALFLNGTSHDGQSYSVLTTPGQTAEMGNSGGAELRMPMWGWGAEPRSIRSSMPLHVLSDLDRMNSIQLGALGRNLKAEEAQEFDLLNKRTGHLGMAWKHRDYVTWRTLLHDAGFTAHSASYNPTASEMEIEARIADIAVRCTRAEGTRDEALAMIRAAMAGEEVSLKPPSF